MAERSLLEISTLLESAFESEKNASSNSSIKGQLSNIEDNEELEMILFGCSSSEFSV